MDKTIGGCAGCGYRPADAQAASPPLEVTPRPAPTEAPRPAPPAPVVVRFESERSVVTKTLAEAYRRAAQAEADMVAATRALERVRSSFLTETDAFEVWELLDVEVGTADSKSLRPVLVFLRGWFEEQLFSRERERLCISFQRDKDVGWREWLTTFAEGLGRWRLLLCQAVLDMAESFPEQFRTPHDFKRATQLIAHQRWTELHQFFKYLAEQEFLPSRTRARLFVSVGQIHLYHFRFLDQALAFFRQSETLAPDQSYVLSALGSYYQERNEGNDLTAARTYFDRAIQGSPGRPDGYLGMGDLALKEGKYEEARGWFQKAISKASFDSSGYSRLLQLYGRPEYIERYESYIPSLAERAVAVDETAEYSTNLEVGDAYVASKRYPDANRWYQKAIDLDRSRPGGYVALGRAYFDEGADKYEAAEQAFQKAVEVAPESYVGYWELGLLREQQQRWDKAAEYYAQVMQRQPEFRPYALVRIGDMQLKMGMQEQAESTLFEALRLDPTADTGTLFKLAEDYDKAGKTSEALRLHDRIRQIKGTSYEASYRNRLGNFYYSKAEYALAAQHYSLAIKANDKVTIYYSNLVEALRKCLDWNGIRALWERMPEDVRQEKAFRVSMSSARNQEANQFYERGEYASAIKLYMEAIAFDPEDAVLRSNLAGAWEHNPDEGLVRFDRGIEALQNACRLDPRSADYSRRLDRLQTLKRLLPAYGTKAYERRPVVSPIAVEVASNLVPLVDAGGTNLSPELLKLIERMRTAISQRYGVRVPGVRFRGNDGYLAGQYVISLMDVALDSNTISLNQRFSPAPGAELLAMGVQAEEVQVPFGGPKGNWVRESDWARVSAAGHELWSVEEYPVRHLQSLLEKYLADFIGYQEVHVLIGEQCPDLLEAILKNQGGVSALTRVLRALLAEQVPVTEFRKIVEHYLKLSQAGTRPLDIVESIRGLAGIVELLPGNEPAARRSSIASKFSSVIEKGIQSTSGIPVLALEPELCQEMLTAVRQSIAAHSPTALLLEDQKLRPFVRELVKLEFPDLAVLSRSELNPAAAPPVGQVEVAS